MAETRGAEGTEEVQGAPDPAAGAEAARPSGGEVLRGAVVAPGLAIGPAHRKDYDISRVGTERVPLDEVDRELNRFRRALDESRAQLVDLKARLQGRVNEGDARILDTHVTYLKDSVFIADVENLILNEQMRLDTAIAKVVSDFDRIFRLVQNETLRQSAVDLRDVGIRVLRNLEQSRSDEVGREAPPQDYVLVARELSIVDMFNLSNEHVKGIVTEEGGLTSHAAVFARSMRIPTLTGVRGLLATVQEGDRLILDATEGLVRVRPDDVLLAQYARSTREQAEPQAPEGDVPEWALAPAATLDGEELVVGAICGNLPEVEQAAQYGMASIALYRTELLYLVDQHPPSRDTLQQHYAAVIGAARGVPTTFRLLNVDSNLEIPYLHERREQNPVLGRVGVRALLAREPVLRRQLQAILLAGARSEVRVAIPFVTDCGELRRVREILFEERLELRKGGEPFQESVPIGVVIETPASMLGIRDLALEADFLLLNLDALQQYLLATDRESAELAVAFESLHPFVLRALAKACEVADAQRRPLTVFGVSALREESLPLLVGTGFRRFCVPPAGLRAFLAQAAAIDARAAARAARAASRSASPQETASLVAGYHHGYAEPERRGRPE